MNRRRILVTFALAAVLMLSSLCWLVPLTRTTDAAPAPANDAAFKGKVLLVSTTSFAMPACLLGNAQVQKIGDHSFLVGKGMADGRTGSWYKGRTVRLQLEHVVSITEFDDLKEAQKALESGAGSAVAIPAISAEAAPALPGVAPVPAAPLPPPPARNP